MSFVKIKKDNLNNQKKKQFFKKKAWKIAFSFLTILVVVSVSFLAYILATGSKVFEGGLKNNSSLLHAFTSESLKNDNGRTNILIIGRGGENHPGGLLTDSLMVMSIKDEKAALVSIPRDLQVPIKNHNKNKINTAFSDGYNDYLSTNCKTSKKKNSDAQCIDGALSAGANLSKETVSNILDIPVHYYIMVDFEGFKNLIDSVGGVDINVEKAIYDPFYPDKNMKGYDPLKIKAGMQHMNGELALKYARSRETTSDFDRAARQQQILSRLREKISQAGYLANPKKILELVNILGDHVRTDFSVNEIKSLSDTAKDVNKDKIIKKVLSNSGQDALLVDDSSTGIYYLKTKSGNFQNIQKFVANIFEENYVIEKAEDIRIEVINGTAKTGLAGKVANDLKNEGYKISSVSTSTQKYKETTIFDYTKGSKKMTLVELKNRFGKNIIEKIAANDSSDFTIILGDDYNSVLQ